MESHGQQLPTSEAEAARWLEPPGGSLKPTLSPETGLADARFVLEASDG